MSPIPCRNTLEDLANLVEHPGLFFDRYMDYPSNNFDQCNEEQQRPHLKDTIKKMARAHVTGTPLLKEWFPPRTSRHIHWRQQTVWRMALHLSKASSTENAAMCLHPVYGFPYIPGTGLKGMARAYAHLELDRKEDDPDVIRIFGSLDSGAGTVIFHDAWPASWPQLELDIVNSHHPDYYKFKGVNNPPGDWENPIPVFFMTLAPETEFRFAVSPLSSNKDHCDDMKIAAEWLQKALQDLGVGAKTAAGYGYFDAPQRIEEQVEAPAQDADTLGLVLQQLKDLEQTTIEDGGYSKKHLDQLTLCLKAIAQARGGKLLPEDIVNTNKIVENNANRTLKRLLKELSQ